MTARLEHALDGGAQLGEVGAVDHDLAWQSGSQRGPHIDVGQHHAPGEGQARPALAEPLLIAQIAVERSHGRLDLHAGILHAARDPVAPRLGPAIGALLHAAPFDLEREQAVPGVDHDEVDLALARVAFLGRGQEEAPRVEHSPMVGETIA